MKAQKVNIKKWIQMTRAAQVEDWHRWDFSIRFRMVEQLLKHGFPAKEIDYLDKSVRTPRNAILNCHE